MTRSLRSVCFGGGTGPGVAYTCLDRAPFTEGGQMFAFAAGEKGRECAGESDAHQTKTHAHTHREIETHIHPIKTQTNAREKNH